MPARIINTHDTESNWYYHNRIIKEGSLFSIDDFNLLEHNIECSVEGKNLISFPFAKQPDEMFGVKLRYENGSVIASGTATKNFLIDLLPSGTAIAAGRYRISGCPKIKGCYVQAYFDGAWGPVDKGYGATFEVQDKLTRVMMQINKDVTVEETVFRPKLQRLLDFSATKVDILGANLIPFPFREQPTNYKGIAFSYNNGVITATGTATDTIYLNLLPVDFRLGKGTYRISGGPQLKGCLLQCYYDGAWGKYTNDEVTFEVTNELTKMLIQIDKGTVLDNAVFKPMLNVGTSILPFEQYKKKTYIPNEDGIIQGIKSEPPVMTFLIDYPDAVVRVSYENSRGFIPRSGEQVIFSIDSEHTSPRLKIGDGRTGVNELPFATDTTLSITGAIADAEQVGKEINQVKKDITTLTGLQQKYLPLTGGTLSGNLYLQGNDQIVLNAPNVVTKWLKITTASHQSDAPTKIAVIGVDGWVRYRSPAEILTDIKAAPATHTHNYLPLTGGIVNGDIQAKNIIGEQLQITNPTHLNSSSSKIAILDSTGKILYRTPTEIRNDINAAKDGIVREEINITPSASGNFTDFSFNCFYYPNLNIAFIRAYAKTAKPISAGVDYKIGSISKYLPAYYYALSVKSSKNINATVGTSGNITLYPKEDIGTNYSLYMAGFWFAAR